MKTFKYRKRTEENRIFITSPVQSCTYFKDFKHTMSEKYPKTCHIRLRKWQPVQYILSQSPTSLNLALFSQTFFPLSRANPIVIRNLCHLLYSRQLLSGRQNHITSVYLVIFDSSLTEEMRGGEGQEEIYEKQYIQWGDVRKGEKG